MAEGWRYLLRGTETSINHGDYRYTANEWFFHHGWNVIADAISEIESLYPVIEKLGTWSGTGAAAGTAGHFRIVDNVGTTCHMQGSVTATGGGGDATVDNTSIAVAQAVTVNTFTINAGNA